MNVQDLKSMYITLKKNVRTLKNIASDSADGNEVCMKTAEKVTFIPILSGQYMVANVIWMIVIHALNFIHHDYVNIKFAHFP